LSQKLEIEVEKKDRELEDENFLRYGTVNMNLGGAEVFGLPKETSSSLPSTKLYSSSSSKYGSSSSSSKYSS